MRSRRAAAPGTTTAGLLLLNLALPGCTLVGTTIGASLDAGARPTTMPGWEVASLKDGQAVTLLLHDGTTVHGRYRGMDPPATAPPSWTPARRAPADSPRHVLIDTAPGRRERVHLAHVAWIVLAPHRVATEAGLAFGLVVDLVLFLFLGVLDEPPL